MASSAERLYQGVYESIFAARTLQTDMLRLSSAVPQYLEDPASERGRSIVGDVHRWYRQHPDPVSAFDQLSTEPERDALREHLQEIAVKQNEAFALAQSENLEEARALYENEIAVLYEESDQILESILTDSSHEMEEFVAGMQETNARINQYSIVFAVILVGLSVSMCMFCARRIRQTSEDGYRQEVLFDLIGRNADDVFEIYSFDDGRMEYVSANLLRVFGVPAETYLADNGALMEYIHPDDREKLSERYYNPHATGVTDAEFRYTNPVTGEQQIFRSMMYPSMDATGENKRYQILLTHDITADRMAHERLQKALEEAERASQSRREFLSRMSHELRTPINAIIGMQALAAGSLDDKEKLMRYLTQISVSARHLLGLVNDVLDMSRIESGRLELQYAPFDLRATLSDIELIQSPRIMEKNQTLVIDVSRCPEMHLVGDELRIRQVLLNLLGNANKYTPDGGTIRLTARQSPPKVGFVHIVFSVEDNGRGVPVDEVHEIFLPFERGSATADKTDGAGLGLSISKHLIEEMGGAIWVESVEGEGSTFSFELSLGVDTEIPEPEVPEYVRDAAEDAVPRILIAEDNEINMEVARELLTQDGFVVEGAANGAEAVEMFESAPEGWYSAILMDIQMPVMDGRTAMRRIRRSTARDGADIPIFEMSANAQAVDKTLEDGFTGSVPKPVDPDRMSALINAAIENTRNKKRDSDDGM